MDPAGLAVMPLEVDDGVGIAAVAALGALFVLMFSVLPALFFTWHAFDPQPANQNNTANVMSGAYSV